MASFRYALTFHWKSCMLIQYLAPGLQDEAEAEFKKVMIVRRKSVARAASMIIKQLWYSSEASGMLISSSYVETSDSSSHLFPH